MLEITAAGPSFREQPLVHSDEAVTIAAERTAMGKTNWPDVEQKPLRQQVSLPQPAVRDTLTGLPNETLLRSVAERITAAHCSYALMVIDIDHFRTINDGLGRQAGDTLLVEISHRFAAAIADDALIVRLGGDEFGLLLWPGAAGFDTVLQAERLHAALVEPFGFNGRCRSFSCSIGIAINTPGPGAYRVEGQCYPSVSELLRDADLAMYSAKQAGRSRTVVFDAAMHTRALTRLNLEADLQAALSREEFELHLQPIVRLADGKIKAFEALVRWKRPGYGLVMPSEFIPALEETGLVIPFGHWSIRESCKIVSMWQQLLPEADWPILSVNLSVRQFEDPDLFEVIGVAVETSNLAPSSLRFEVTESLTMQDLDRGVDVLRRIAGLGCGISLDDFGTGYSSLGHLRSLPIDCLKIDRSFVSEMQDEGGSLRIVRAILGLAASIGLSVVAEGIETEEQAALLALLGCSYGQGYLFARPLPVADATRLLERDQGLRLETAVAAVAPASVEPAVAFGMRLARHNPLGLCEQLRHVLSKRLQTRPTLVPPVAKLTPCEPASTPSSDPGSFRKSWTRPLLTRRWLSFLIAPMFMILHAGLILALPRYSDPISPLCLAGGPVVALVACLRMALLTKTHLRSNWMLAALAFLFWGAGSILAVWMPMEASAGAVDFCNFLCSLALLFAMTAPENNGPGQVFLLMDGLQALLGAFLGYIVVFGAVPFSSEKLTPLSGSSLLWIYDVENLFMAFLAALRLLGSNRSPARRRFDWSMLLFTFAFGSMASLYDHIAPANTSALDAMLDPAFFLMAALASLPFADRTVVNERRVPLTTFVDGLGPVFMTAAVLLVGAWIAEQRPVPGVASILVAVGIYAIRVSLLQARYLVTHQQLRQTRDQMERLALEDGLTGVGNRRAYDAALNAMWADAELSGEPLSMLLIDVDHFKVYNDRHGHPDGDACLIRIAQVLQTITRRNQGTVARYGGEEFAILLPNVPRAAASKIASDIRRAVAVLDLTSRLGDPAPVTVSIGVATARRAGSVEALLLAVDDALYRAKRKGRDRIETEELEAGSP